ncbi:ribosomal protein S18 acetylase RimI-like enzyme [Xylanimonas ulmi]|uniref:Ribosomal protein S18 acetylase RimI-like enzyme n=2 Tax=Xylanimonas ulmi TaxID=228973 RepID=A0A4Q7LZG4_9MICO|nr:ribosomal protein S18 acetylase RimI-like enzyme [Xylanibacterium ulmi]
MIRPVRAHEWREIRALRLEGVQGDVDRLAFAETFEQEAAKPDEFWQERAAGSSLDAGADAGARQFVAIADDGTWVGSSVVLIESAGGEDYEDRTIEQSGGHIVGVYVNSEHRGTGLVEELFNACLEWARERGLGRVRLYVHQDNARAQGAYRKCGFEPTGVLIEGDSLGCEVEMARAV